MSRNDLPGTSRQHYQLEPGHYDTMPPRLASHGFTRSHGNLPSAMGSHSAVATAGMGMRSQSALHELPGLPRALPPQQLPPQPSGAGSPPAPVAVMPPFVIVPAKDQAIHDRLVNVEAQVHLLTQIQKDTSTISEPASKLSESQKVKPVQQQSPSQDIDNTIRMKADSLVEYEREQSDALKQLQERRMEENEKYKTRIRELERALASKDDEVSTHKKEKEQAHRARVAWCERVKREVEHQTHAARGHEKELKAKNEKIAELMKRIRDLEEDSRARAQKKDEEYRARVQKKDEETDQRLRGCIQELDVERRQRMQAEDHCLQADRRLEESEARCAQLVAENAKLIQENRGLVAELENKMRAEQDLKKAEQDAKKAEQDAKCKLAVAESDKAEIEKMARETDRDNRQWIEKLSEKKKESAAKMAELQKENQMLQKQLGESNNHIWNHQIQLQQERLNFQHGRPNPSQFKQMIKEQDKEAMCQERTNLARQLAASDHELQICYQHLQDREAELHDLRVEVGLAAPAA